MITNLMFVNTVNLHGAMWLIIADMLEAITNKMLFAMFAVQSWNLEASSII